MSGATAPDDQGTPEKVGTGESGKDGGAGGYPEWAAAMQAAYYKGPPGHASGYYGAPMAPPYHPHMWGGQPMMPPYGTPPPGHYGYGSMYHPPPMGPPPPNPTSYGYAAPPAGTPTKQVEGTEARPALIANVPPGTAPAVAATGNVLRENSDGSTDGSGEEPLEGMNRKRNYDAMGGSSDNMQQQQQRMALTSTPANGTAAYPYGTPGSEMWGVHIPRSRSSGGLNGDAAATLPYQDERELKRQRRKQSNRESARRSRLRKQAECEGLESKVQNLETDNANLRNELVRLQDKCAQLTAENTALHDQAHAAGLSVMLPPPPESNQSMVLAGAPPVSIVEVGSALQPGIAHPTGAEMKGEGITGAMSEVPESAPYSDLELVAAAVENAEAELALPAGGNRDGVSAFNGSASRRLSAAKDAATAAAESSITSGSPAAAASAAVKDDGPPPASGVPSEWPKSGDAGGVLAA